MVRIHSPDQVFVSYALLKLPTILMKELILALSFCLMLLMSATGRANQLPQSPDPLQEKLNFLKSKPGSI